MPADPHPAPHPEAPPAAQAPTVPAAAGGTATPDGEGAPGTMRAVVHDRYGPARVLRTARLPVPVPAAGRVLVRVAAAGVDRGTVHLMTGRPLLMRLVTGLRRPRNPVPGRDVAGTVVAVGPGVTRVAPGDAVFGTADGSLAEYAVAPETRLTAAPATIPLTHAAAIPVSGLTALQALDRAGVGGGSRVLVLGASGGVGTHAVQIARARGAVVTGVCSAAKADLVRALGADEVVAHDTPGATLPAGPYDAVIDIGGRTPVRALRAVLTRRGVLVLVGAEGGDALTGVGRQIRAVLLSPLVPQRMVMLVSREQHADMDRLRDLVDAGDLRPALDTAYPLERAAEAVARVATGAARGKVTVVP